MSSKYWRVQVQGAWHVALHGTRESESGRWRKQINGHRNLDKRNSVEERRGSATARRRAHIAANASISRAITYLNAVPVISCCPLFDNNLRPPATTRFLAAATNEKRNKTRTREQLCAWLRLPLRMFFFFLRFSILSKNYQNFKTELCCFIFFFLLLGNIRLWHEIGRLQYPRKLLYTTLLAVNLTIRTEIKDSLRQKSFTACAIEPGRRRIYGVYY